MLYPREDKTDPDKNSLVFACGMCDHYETAEEANYCVWQHELSNTVGETAGITQDVAADPSVGAHQPRSLSTSQTPSSTAAVAPSSTSASTSKTNEGNKKSGQENGTGKVKLQKSLGQSMLLDDDGIPLFCTMCGQEITCEICGQPTENGVWLEVGANGDGSDAVMTDVSDVDDTDEPLYSPGLQYGGFGDHNTNVEGERNVAENEGGILGQMKAL